MGLQIPWWSVLSESRRTRSERDRRYRHLYFRSHRPYKRKQEKGSEDEEKNRSIWDVYENQNRIFSGGGPSVGGPSHAKSIVGRIGDSLLCWEREL